jgi:hypothetical protein
VQLHIKLVLGLLNEARVHTETIIDILYKSLKDKAKKKPRTYRNLARKNYLAIAKQRRPTPNKKRQAIKKQLQYIKINLAHIEQLIELGATKKQALEDERIRNAIEGKFGQGKRRFGLNRSMAKLDNTSETVIAITFLVMNLSTWLRRVFFVFLCRSGKTTPVFGWEIISNYNWRGLTQEKIILNRA